MIPPIIKTIPRDAGDTSKGYTLQKLRTISLILSEIQRDHTVDFIAAVEFNGDVFLDNRRITYVEENKAYDSKNFSFASEPVKNTICYFLDYWLNNNRDQKIRFGFYSTNEIAKEVNRGQTKALQVKLPRKAILGYLRAKDYSDPNLLPAVKTLILSEYKYQYENNKDHTLAGSHFATLSAFTNSDWQDFFNVIDWIFDNDQIEDLEKKIIVQIGNVTFDIPLITTGKEPFIRAELFYQLELRQNKQVISERFLDRKEVELIFHRAINGIHDESYKYLLLDYKELRNNTQHLLENFINDKYFAISGLKSLPVLLSRKVGLFDPNLRVEGSRALSGDTAAEHRIQGYFDKIINSSDPVFLFGELGSGKSTIVANYMLEILSNQPEIIPVFLSSGYLQDKALSSLEEIIAVVNQFVNNELPLTDKIFDLNVIFKTNKEVIVVFDGLDELPIRKARQLVTNLKRLQQNNKRLKIIATGRPVELQGILPAGWHSLITLPLNDSEIQTVLTNEALANGVPADEALQDAALRLSYLKRRSELYAISKNPLVLCSVWPELNELLGDKTLGDLLYGVIERRLNWHEKDNKGIEENSFFTSYPSIFSREVFLKIIARELFFSAEKAITDAKLNQLIVDEIGDIPDKQHLTADTVQFFKNTFLQKTSNSKYGFISSPLLECALGLEFCDILLNGGHDARLFTNWRPLSFSLAIARSKELEENVKGAISTIIAKHLTWPDNNVAQAAIILAEYKNVAICTQFFESLKRLAFRPVRTMEQSDQLTTYSMAYCMHLAGEIAFEWFWNEYLSCENPLIHYQGKLAADILQQYLIINDFVLPLDKQTRLESIIKPNLHYSTSLCYEVLPVLATLTSNEFSLDERCLLLAGLVTSDVLHLKATELLEQIAKDNLNNVLDALESICSKDRTGFNTGLPELWFRLNIDRDISQVVLSSALKAVGPANYSEVLTMITKYISKDNLIAYLKYNIIAETDLAGPSALLLFWTGNRDQRLLSASLIKSIDWLDKRNYFKTGELSQFIADQSSNVVDVLIQNMPSDRHNGLPPGYWMIFLPTLINSERLHTDDFITVVSRLDLLILSRYPEIRILLSNLLKTKVEYREALEKSMLGLRTSLRYRSAAILLVTNPENEFRALEIILAGFVSSLGELEWRSLCLGLNYGRKTLEYIHSIIAKLTDIAAVFALMLLHYYRFTLKPEETTRLIDGLLGEGYFFDRRGARSSFDQAFILSNPDYLDRIISYFNHPDKKRAEHATSVAFEYHFEKLDLSQKVEVWLLQVEAYDQSFFDFSIQHLSLFNEGEFSKALKTFGEQYEALYRAKPLLLIFHEAWTTAANWKPFLISFLKKYERHNFDRLEDCFQWLLTFARKNPEFKKPISVAVSELLEIPAYKERTHDNSVFPQLVLMASAFNVQVGHILTDVLENYSVSLRTEEVFCALAILSGANLSTLERAPKKMYLNVFYKYVPSPVVRIKVNELENLLIDTEDIPDRIIEKTSTILLYGNITNQELSEIDKKGLLAGYFVAVIRFCRDLPIDILRLMDLRDIGGQKHLQLQATQLHRRILFTVIRILVDDTENRERLIKGFELQLEVPNEEHFIENLLQLMYLGKTFRPEIILKMLAVILDSPYLIRSDFTYQLSLYIVNKIPTMEKERYAIEIDKHLFGMYNHFEKDGIDTQYNMALWLLSLASLYLRGEVNEYSRTGFLLGLQYVFLEKNSLQRNLLDPPPYFFKAGDLLKLSYPLFNNIKPSLIREIVSYGATSNIPEISACCHVLAALAGGK